MAREHGLRQTKDAPRWLMLGYLVGREWDVIAPRGGDMSKLREFVRNYLSRGRKRG